MALLQGIKKLFGPLLDDLRRYERSAESGGWLVWYHHTGNFSQGKDILKAKRASLAD